MLTVAPGGAKAATFSLSCLDLTTASIAVDDYLVRQRYERTNDIYD